MSHALTSSPKPHPPSRSRGGSGGSSHLAAPRPLGIPVAQRSGSFAGTSTNAPGSFSSSMRSATTLAVPLSTTTSTLLSNEYSGASSNSSGDGISPTSEKLVEELNDKLNRAIKYKEGAENLLQVLGEGKKAKEAKEAEREYYARNNEILLLKEKIAAITRPRREEEVRAAIPGRSGLRFPADLDSMDVDSGKDTRRIPGGGLLAMNGLGRSGLGDELLGGDDGDAESPTVSLTDILRDLEEGGEKQQQSGFLTQRANDLVLLFKRHPNLKYELNWNTFGMRLKKMLLHQTKEVVAAGYRVTRYAFTDVESLRTIRGLHTDYLVVLSLASKSNLEREQALKFVRAFLEVPGGVREIGRSVIRAIVAIAEFSDDRLRGIAIETLAEMLTLDPELVVSAGGVRVLTQVLADGPWEIADALSLAFLYLLDMPESRKYVRPGHDLEIVFAAFTDTSSVPKAVDEERLRSSAKVISSMMKSWPGLICLSMYNMRALRSLVDSLRIPSSIVRDIILELFFDIFRIRSPSWSSTFLAGRRLTTYGRVANLKSDPPPKPGKDSDRGQGQLVDHFTSLLLAVFVDAGLMEVLITLVKDPQCDAPIVRKTTLLLGETLKLASQLLPSSYSAKMQLLPELFSTAARIGFDDRFTASSAVYQIDSLNRTLYRSLPSAVNSTQRSVLEDGKREQRQKELMQKLNMTLDNQHFGNLIVETGVVDKKSYTKWNWMALNEVISGPLLNSKRLDEAIKGTKFMKRLLSFYRPFKYRFCEIRNTKPNQRYVDTGVALFRTLLQTAEGVRFLGENKILKQISLCLGQLTKGTDTVGGEPLFSASRLQDTLSWGYFQMLGVLSSDPKGLQMMEKWQMFSAFYYISDLQSRNDLLELFVNTMDFSLEGHPRIILSKVLTAGPKNVRLFATNHLRTLVTPETTDTGHSVSNAKKDETAEWAIRLLITQLYDPDVEVCETAVKILEEACNSTHSLEYVVKCRPTLDHLGEIGAPLLLRFLSTSVGYHYLNELDYINKEMDDWFHGRNDSYVLTVEASLARAFFDDPAFSSETYTTRHTRPSSSSSHSSPSSLPSSVLGRVPPHFYRELARTTEGCALLRSKGHFSDFSDFIRSNRDECSDPEIVTKVKGCLWAVGNIGSMPYGAPFLEEEGVVEDIIWIAEQSEVLTLKGTAFFVLGLISRTWIGVEILGSYGWEAGVEGVTGEPKGLVMPTKIGGLLYVEPWKHTRDETSNQSRPSLLSTIGNEDSIDTRILRAISNLSNHIKEKASAGELLKLKQSHPTRFLSQELFTHTMSLLESFRYRFPVRRFIVELFDRSVVEAIVMDGGKEKEMQEENSTGGLSPDDVRETEEPDEAH